MFKWRKDTPSEVVATHEVVEHHEVVILDAVFYLGALGIHKDSLVLVAALHKVYLI